MESAYAELQVGLQDFDWVAVSRGEWVHSLTNSPMSPRKA